MWLSCAEGQGCGALGWRSQRCLDLHTHLWQKTGEQEAKHGGVHGQGTTNLTRNMRKLTLEFEQSSTTMCGVLSLHPLQFSASKKANTLLKIFILSYPCFCETMKCPSQFQNTRFSNQGRRKIHYYKGELSCSASVGRWKTGLKQTVTRGGSLKTAPCCLTSQFHSKESELQVGQALYCSVGGNSEALAKSWAWAVSDCLDSTALEASLLCVHLNPPPTPHPHP